MIVHATGNEANITPTHTRSHTTSNRFNECGIWLVYISFASPLYTSCDVFKQLLMRRLYVHKHCGMCGTNAIHINILQSSPEHEGPRVGTLCLCSCDGGCGDSLCVHSSGGCEGEPGTHQDSEC